MSETSSGTSTADRTASSNGSQSGEDARSTEQTRRVGVLSPHNSKETKAILNAVRALGHEPVWIREQNVTSRIDGGTVHVAPAVDVLINRLLLTKSDQQLEDLQLAALYGAHVPVLNAPQAVQRTLHKYRAGAQLAASGLPVPDAFFGRSPRTVAEWPETLPGTAVQKPTIGTNGQRMAIVSPDDTVTPQVAHEQSFVQEFLEHGDERPSDVRVYVVGDRIVGAMRRHAPRGDWRTNVALGAEVEDVTDDLGQQPRSLAKEATAVLDLDLAGVDLMSVGDTWYVLEVNATAGFKGLFAATGTSAAPHIARLAIERAGVGVARSRVTELEATLDDSVPACKPPLEDADGDGGDLGYTTRIRISASGRGESAVAKVDTGADRTSIDTELAGRIGAGPLVGTTEVRSGTTDAPETRPLVGVDISVNGRWRSLTVSVTDRGDMTYPVLLGRDVLKDYTVDINQRVEE